MTIFNYKPECWCEDSENKMECKYCGVTWDNEECKWKFTVPGTTYFYKCRHEHFKVKMPDGVNIYASSVSERAEDDKIPDWGLYLDPSWKPRGMAGFIEWPDYKLPLDWEAAALMIVDAYRKASTGSWVEVGCIGGHGRTGTVLACMAVLGGLYPEEAIRYIKTEYCSSATDTAAQRWWVEWFHSYINGGSTTKAPLVKNWSCSNKIFTFDKGISWRTKKLFHNRGKPPVDICNTTYYRYTKFVDPPEQLEESEDYNSVELYLENIEYELENPTKEDLTKIDTWVVDYLAKRHSLKTRELDGK